MSDLDETTRYGSNVCSVRFGKVIQIWDDSGGFLKIWDEFPGSSPNIPQQLRAIRPTHVHGIDPGAYVLRTGQSFFRTEKIKQRARLCRVGFAESCYVRFVWKKNQTNLTSVPDNAVSV